MTSLEDIQLLYTIIGAEEMSTDPATSNQISNPVDEALAQVSLDFQEFFEEYTGIPKESQAEHIARVQAAFPQVFSWPGVSDLQLLNYNIRQHPRYAYLLGQLRTSSTFNPPVLLVVGTTFGQDLRYLLHDGIPASKLYACFLRPEFYNASAEFFCDAATFPQTHSIRAEALVGEPSSPLYRTAGSWTAINSNNYLNRFDLETQEHVAHTMLALLRQEEGSILLGSVLGQEEIGSLEPVNTTGIPYRHSSSSLRTMWARVQQQSGVNIFVEIEEGPLEGLDTTSSSTVTRIFFFVEIQAQSQQSEWRVFG